MPYQALDVARFNIDDSLTESEVEALAGESKLEVLQFAGPLSPVTFDRLEKRLFPRRPEVCLRTFGFYSDVCDLSFLRRLPSLREFSADCLMEAKGLEDLAELPKLRSLRIGIYRLENYDFLERVTERLEGLSLGETRRKLPVPCLPRFGKLRRLALHGNPRDLASLKDLPRIEELRLLGMKAPDLRSLSPLSSLRRLDVSGGSAGDLTGLAGAPTLRHLSLGRILGLSDLRHVSRCPALETLDLFWLKQVKLLPDFGPLSRFRAIYFNTLKGLRSLEPLGDAPALEYIRFWHASNLDPKDFLPVFRAPRLKAVAVGFGTLKKNRALEAMLAERGLSTTVPDSDRLPA